MAAISRISAVPTILRVVCRMTGMGFAAVARVTETSWTTCAVQDEIGFGLLPGAQLELATTLCKDVREQRQPIVIESVLEDPHYCEHPTPRQYGFQSYISVPILLPDGEYFGNLCAIDPRPAAPLAASRTLEVFQLFAELIGEQFARERQHMETGAALASERATAELREQFIAVLGHDLRTPLSTISTVGHLLQRKEAPPDLPKLGTRLLASTGRMAALINDVLDFARGRLGAGMTLRLSREEALDVLLGNVVSELQMTHEGREIRWSVDIRRPVLCDGARLQQLLSNLVKNALTHGSPQAPVTVEVASDDAHLVLSVHNGGNPIQPEQLERVFEPYWRSSDGHEQGLGLGLYICSQIVKAHGGQLEVRSTRETGTCFAARVPVDGAA